MKSLLRSARVQYLLAKLLGLYLDLVLRTTRWTIEGQPHFVPLAAGRPTVVAFWHEYLPLMPVLPALGRRQRVYKRVPVHVLVSQHRDGRFIGDLVYRFGLDTIHGSSSKGGAASLRKLLAVLGKGEIIAITPDGPRGPRRQAAPGVAQLAALAGVPVLPCAARINWRVQLNSWDRMAIPLPFARAVVVFGAAITVPRDTWKDTVPLINEAMNQVAERADQFWPA